MLSKHLKVFNVNKNNLKTSNNNDLMEFKNGIEIFNKLKIHFHNLFIRLTCKYELRRDNVILWKIVYNSCLSLFVRKTKNNRTSKVFYSVEDKNENRELSTTRNHTNNPECDDILHRINFTGEWNNVTWNSLKLKILNRPKIKNTTGKSGSDGGSSGKDNKSDIRNSNLVLCCSKKLSVCVTRLIFTILVILCMPNLSTSFHHNIKYSVNIVKTKYGPLRGIIIRNNPTVEAFLGVPYASPPVGSLRYMPPVTPSTWRTTRLADRFSAVCPQVLPILPNGPEALLEVPRGRLSQLRRLLPLLTNQSEDCLYLNLYVPRSSYPAGQSSSSSSSPLSPMGFSGDTNNSGQGVKGPNFNESSGSERFDAFSDTPQDKPIPAIVYIHGESYEWNSGNLYDGSILAAYGKVIVITINFRLGILGFLKTGGKGSAQGNFGLMDLVAGLHWLRENLPAFGGDPNKVTIMGHGTGAALANILVVSPVASDLVHRAILISGSALSPWAIQKDPVFIKRRVAAQTGCHGDMVVDDLAPCLRTKSIAELLAVKIDLPRFLPGFAPFIDGTVIVHPSGGSAGPLTLPAGSAIASTSGIELADFPSRELIFGLTTIESYLDFNAQDLEFGFNETRRDRILRTYVRNVYHYHLNEIYAALKNEYTDWERAIRNPMGSRDASLEFLSDGHTAAPLIRLGYLHSLRGGKSYFLHFRHQSGERDFPQRSGSVRGEDVPFCLGLPISPLYPYNYTKQDIKISRLLLQYISNFVQTGNPNEIPTSSHDISHIVHGKSTFIESPFPLTSSSLLSSSLSVLPPIAVSLPPSSKSPVKSTSLASSSSPPGAVIKHTNNSYLSSKTPTSASQSTFNLGPSFLIPSSAASSTSSMSLLSSSVSELAQSSSLSSSSSSSSLSASIDAALLTKASLRTSVKSISNSRRHAVGNILRRKRKIIKYRARKHSNNSNKFFQRKIYQEKSHGNNPKESESFIADQGVTGTVARIQGNHHHRENESKVSDENQNENEDEDEDEDEEDEQENDDEGNDEDDFTRIEENDKGSSSYSKNHYARKGEDDDDDDDDDVGNNDDDDSDEKRNTEKFDRFDDVTITKLPFWDTYDSINQLYLELGSKVEIRNHYRGHKLSMWLSLIPQLHSPADFSELPVRHHHFPEENAQYYDGIVRPQITQRPSFPKVTIPQAIGPQSSAHQTTTTRINLTTSMNSGVSGVTTECPPNTTIVPTIAATRPQNHQQNGSTPSGVISLPAGSGIVGQANKPENNNLLRRLANSQYQSYTTALMVTIAVGCFLLLLNILIFAGIYYQREKRANDAKKKEELQEAENRCTGSPNIEKIERSGFSGGGKGSRKSSLQSLAGFGGSGSFAEYSCYEEKLQRKEKHALADICSVELPLKEFKCPSSPVPSNTGSLRRSANTSNPTSIVMYPPSYRNTQQNPHKVTHHFPEQQQGCSNNSIVTYQKYQKSFHQHQHSHQHQHPQQQQQQQQQKQQTSTSTTGRSPELCNQSTQSEQPNVQDVGTSVDEKVVGSISSSKTDAANSSGSGDSGIGNTVTVCCDGKSGNDDDIISPGIPEPPPPPKSSAPYQGGILRQPGPPTTPGSNKKRVQIQEISV